MARFDLGKIFKDTDGKVVIAQMPNAPLIIAFGFYALQYVPLTLIHMIGQWGFMIAILYWAYLEIVFGVNTWRRILGVGVAIFLVAQRLM